MMPRHGHVNRLSYIVVFRVCAKRCTEHQPCRRRRSFFRRAEVLDQAREVRLAESQRFGSAGLMATGLA
jgi:hypothetical protein